MMKRIKGLSFSSKTLLCALLSFLINSFVETSLKSSLSKTNYLLEVNTAYNIASSMELYYDTGNSFNRKQKVIRKTKRGENKLSFPFVLNEGDHLRYVRLDFGSDKSLEQVELHSVTLYCGKKTLFKIKKEEIGKKLSLLKRINLVDDSKGIFVIDNKKTPIDPYINFISIRDLIFPKWLQVFLLVVPWMILFCFPAINWLKDVVRNKEYMMLFITLFLISIPLKIAWVSFTSILLLVYAVFVLYKKKEIRFSTVQFAVNFFFIIPLIFTHDGFFSNATKSLGFLFFPIIFSVIDFSKKTDKIQKIYINIFFVIMSIMFASWLILIIYTGYYYKITLSNYFTEIKSHAHSMMFWLYYAHTTFLSFFILVGVVFCQDLYRQGIVSK